MKLKVVRSSRGFDGNNMPIRKWRMASGELRIGSLATRHSPLFTRHFFSLYKSRITKKTARYKPVRTDAYIKLRSSPA